MSYKMSNGEKQKRPNCLICGGQISSSNYGVFCTVVPNTDTLLANAVEKIVCKKLVRSVLSAASICAKCFSLFEELACAETKCTSIKKKILTFFERNSHRIKNGIQDIQGVACQTEDVIEINSVVEKPDDKLKEEECEPDTENSCEKSATEQKTDTGKVTPRTSIVAAGKAGAYSKRKGRPARKPHTSKQISNKLSSGQEKDVHRVRRYIHPCSLCGRLFRRPCEVKQHLLSHGGAKPYQCRDCGKKFGSKSGAGIHALKKHGKDITEENIIDLCKDGTFINSSSDQVNMMVERDNKVKKEVDDHRDNDTTSSDDDFEWKMDEEEIFGMFSSEGQKFDSVTNSPDKATSSETEQNGTVNVKNEDVKKDITEDKSKEEEAKLSDTGKPSQGSRNNEENNDSKDDKRARKEKKRKREPAPKVPKHECGICGKKWRTMSEYRSHVATHSDERPYICEICGQAYKHKPALDIHVGMHNGINPFCCPYCNKAFTQKGALQRHMPIHTGEAPFQCELCGKRFVHHTSFNMHTLAHTGQKSYKCGLCGLALLSGSHLKRHSRVHTGERPYQCQTCGKRFAERYNLVAHTRVHDTSSNSGVRDGGYKKHHRCQLCGARFDRRPKLDHHMALCHNKLGESEDNQKWIGHTMTEESSKQTASDLGTMMPSVTLSQPHLHSVAPTSAHQHRPLLLHTVHGQTHGPEHEHSHTHGSKVTAAHSHGHPHAHPLLAAAAAHQTLSVPNQHQQNWHQIIFGGNGGVRAEDGAGNLLDGVPQVKVGMQSAGINGTAQHRLLTEMPSLGHSTQNHSIGVSIGTGRNVLASCLAAAAPHHLVANSHAPHLTNHHSVTQSRVNMFSSGES
ncbi:zinc finger protein 431-like isoform X1 [Schistocerca cancellata]|uniref:zinc finger protein 431-like isoform X1 n=1 Tax=Schistocerca cancellata TaxID=274614 RepID=UPI0021193FF1|nr:zinc finger protein 431-like isoform X1 [Schistocerca cancellata]